MTLNTDLKKKNPITKLGRSTRPIGKINGWNGDMVLKISLKF